MNKNNELKADEQKVNLVAKDDLSVLIKKGGNKDFTRKIKLNENPAVPIKKGTALGYVEVYQGKTLVGKVDFIVTDAPLLNNSIYF